MPGPVGVRPARVWRSAKAGPTRHGPGQSGQLPLPPHPLNSTFRYARLDELEQVARLSAHSFPGLDRGLNWWVERLQLSAYGDGPEIIWVGEEDGRVIAACQLHRLRHWISGEEVAAMGLGTVAIAPTHRQRGIAARLVESALHAAAERGDLVSSLYPFRASFYGRLGYGPAGEAHQYMIAPTSLSLGDERERIEIVRDEAGVLEVDEFYQRWARTQTGQVRRTLQAWRATCQDPGRLLVVHRDVAGTVTGYALASYPSNLPPGERYLSVDEHAWLTVDSRRGIHAWLASMGDQWQRVALRALPGHRLGDWLRDSRQVAGHVPPWGIWFPSATLLRGPMFRLLDLAKAWNNRAIGGNLAMTVALEVTDAQLPANQGDWRMRLAGGRVEVSRGSGNADLHLRLDIRELSRIYMGTLPVAAGVNAGLVEVDRSTGIEALDRALRLPEAWTFDRY